MHGNSPKCIGWEASGPIIGTEPHIPYAMVKCDQEKTSVASRVGTLQESNDGGSSQSAYLHKHHWTVSRASCWCDGIH